MIIDPQSRIGDNATLQIQAEYFNEAFNETQQQINNTDNPIEQEELQERINGLTTARDQTIEQRQLEEVRGQQEEDISRLQRFKEWLKENWLVASSLGATIAALAISIARIITTVVIGARSAIVKGGEALGKLGKAITAVHGLAKQAGPLLATLLNVIATALKWGAAGVAWLASNLWVLVIALVWFAYDQYGLRPKHRK